LPSDYSQTLIGTAGSSNLVGNLTPAPKTEVNLGSTNFPWYTIYAKNFAGNKTFTDATVFNGSVEFCDGVTFVDESTFNNVAHFNKEINICDSIVFGNSNHIYGTEDQRLALSPSLGQIFF
jgi:hypothetical protein